MKDTQKYLNIFSLLLCIVIVVLLLVGCSKKNRFERFENKKKEVTIEKFQNSILEGVASGTINSNMIKRYIEEKKISKEDIDAIITKIASSVVSDK